MKSRSVSAKYPLRRGEAIEKISGKATENNVGINGT